MTGKITAALVALSLFSGGAAAQAQTPPKAPAPAATAPTATVRPAPTALALSPADRADLQRIETWLNTEMRSMKANFLQINDQGALARGTFYLQRPGKMRFEYDPPTPVLMVADGTFLVYHDSMLNQTSHIPLGTTPIGFLVRDQIKLSGDLTVTAFERGAGTLRVALRQSKDWDQGELTLVFSDKPLLLQQWTVLDPQKRTTRVSLVNIQLGGKYDSKLFYFATPNTQQSGQ